MELRTLRAFVEVVRQGGFSQAAKTLNATQSTVSKAVKQLEEELGERLLDRDTSGVRLTGAGEIVLRHANTVLANCDDLIRELNELRWLKKGTLRLGIPAFSAGALIAPTFAAYRRKFPGIDIVITESGSARQEEMLAAGDLDLAALLVPARSDFEWDEQNIIEIRFVAALSKNHPLADRVAIGVGDLKDQSLLMLPEDTAATKFTRQIWDNAGFEPKVVAQSGQLHFLTLLAGEGVGVAIVPEVAILPPRSAVIRTIPIDHPLAIWRLVFAWRRGSYVSHAARAWLALSRETSGSRGTGQDRAGQARTTSPSPSPIVNRGPSEARRD
jgi:DNA-binding transcriptional LysR family regulator